MNIDLADDILNTHVIMCGQGEKEGERKPERAFSVHRILFPNWKQHMTHPDLTISIVQLFRSLARLLRRRADKGILLHRSFAIE